MKRSMVKGMNLQLGSTTRIAFALGMWAATVLLGLRMFGVLDDGVRSVLNSRVKRCDSIAFACAELISRNQSGGINSLLEYHVDHSRDIVAAKCTMNGKELFRSDQHDDRQWQNAGTSSLTCIRIPIQNKPSLERELDSATQSGAVDITFTAPVGAGISGFFSRKSILVTVMASALNLLGFMFITRRCFRDLDPSQVVPDRVRSAFDTMAEMVVVLDQNDRIALTNKSFDESVKLRRVQGQHVDSLPWSISELDSFSELMERMLAGLGEDRSISLKMSDGKTRTLKANVSEIMDEAGKRRGSLVSLVDITTLEEKTVALQTALDKLQSSQLEIEQQNEQLTFLATRDPMTGCFNRRAFFEKTDELWKTTIRYRHPLSCVMVDVDHFKSINDNHGHAVGDEVLIQVATALQETARETDYVCRYGGEEFCILLPHVNIDGVAVASERFRNAISSLQVGELTVTASLGCSSVEFGADSPAAMIDQADQALYVAKEHGRNRVVRFDQIADVESEPDVDTCPATSAQPPKHRKLDGPRDELSNNSIDELFAAAEL